MNKKISCLLGCHDFSVDTKPGFYFYPQKRCSKCGKLGYDYESKTINEFIEEFIIIWFDSGAIYALILLIGLMIMGFSI